MENEVRVASASIWLCLVVPSHWLGFFLKLTHNINPKNRSIDPKVSFSSHGEICLFGTLKIPLGLDCLWPPHSTASLEKVTAHRRCLGSSWELLAFLRRVVFLQLSTFGLRHKVIVTVCVIFLSRISHISSYPRKVSVFSITLVVPSRPRCSINAVFMPWLESIPRWDVKTEGGREEDREKKKTRRQGGDTEREMYVYL